MAKPTLAQRRAIYDGWTTDDLIALRDDLNAFISERDRQARTSGKWPSVMINGGMAVPLKANCSCGEGVAGYMIDGVAHVSRGACIITSKRTPGCCCPDGGEDLRCSVHGFLA